MKHLTLIFLILNLALYAKAQDTCQYFEWANGGTSPNRVDGADIAVDAAGNSYATGFFTSSVTIGGHTLISQGNQDMYVVKTDPQGQVVWATRAGGNYMSSIIFARSIAIDAMGNSYVSGNFMGAVSFGNTTLTNLSSGRWFFIAKLDPAGQFLWAVQADSAYQEGSYSKALAVDAQGNCFIHGGLSGTSTFGSATLVPSTKNYLFLAKLNTNGQYEWAYNIGGSKNNNNHPYGISLDASDNILISGGYGADTMYIGNQILAPHSHGNMYIAKFNGQGQLMWANNAKGGMASGYHFKNCSDINGNSYVIGSFGGTAEFGNITLTANPNRTAFIAKLDPNGQFIAAIKVLSDNTTSSISRGLDITADDKSNLYVTGYFVGTAIFGNTTLNSPNVLTYHTFIAKLEPQDMTFEWAVSNTKGNVLGYSIGIDSAENCYITGAYIDSVLIGNTTLTTTEYNMFVAKLSTECPTDITILNKNTEPIKVYPNPVQGNGFSLILSEQYQSHKLEVNIYDITGRKLHNHKGSIEEINQYLSSITTNAAKGLWTIQIISHTSGKSKSVRVSVR